MRLTNYSANRVAAEVQLVAPANVVLTDLPWPEWELRIDGILQAADTTPPADRPATNAAPVQRRVQLPAGSHGLVWTYRPRSLWWGVALACITAGGVIVVARWGTP